MAYLGQGRDDGVLCQHDIANLTLKILSTRQETSRRTPGEEGYPLEPFLNSITTSSSSFELLKLATLQSEMRKIFAGSILYRYTYTFWQSSWLVRDSGS